MNLEATHRNFRHPLHTLHLSNHQAADDGDSTLICRRCNHSLSGWIYGCEPCKFFMHVHCCRFPNTTKHPLLDLCNHVIHLRTTLDDHQGAFTCHACQKQGYGMCYSCNTCKEDLHIRCAALPLKLHTHVHELHEVCLKWPRESKSFSCSVCGNIRHNQWCYRCEICDVDICLACARPKPMKGGTSNASQVDGSKGSSRVLFSEERKRGSGGSNLKELSQRASSLSLSIEMKEKSVMKNRDRLQSFRNTYRVDEKEDEDDNDDDNDDDHHKRLFRRYCHHHKESGDDDDDNDDDDEKADDHEKDNDDDDDDEKADDHEKDNDDDDDDHIHDYGIEDNDDDDNDKYGPIDIDKEYGRLADDDDDEYGLNEIEREYGLEENNTMDDSEEEDVEYNEVEEITDEDIRNLWVRK